MITVVHKGPHPIPDLQGRLLPAIPAPDHLTPSPGKVLMIGERVMREVSSLLDTSTMHWPMPVVGLFLDCNSPLVIEAEDPELKGLIGYPLVVCSSKEAYVHMCEGTPVIRPLAEDLTPQHRKGSADSIPLLINSKDGWRYPRIIQIPVQQCVPLEELLVIGGGREAKVGVLLLPQPRAAAFETLEPQVFRDEVRVNIRSTMTELLRIKNLHNSAPHIPSEIEPGTELTIEERERTPEFITNDVDVIQQVLVELLSAGSFQTVVQLDQAIARALPAEPDAIGFPPRVLEYRQLLELKQRAIDLTTKAQHGAYNLADGALLSDLKYLNGLIFENRSGGYRMWTQWGSDLQTQRDNARLEHLCQRFDICCRATGLQLDVIAPDPVHYRIDFGSILDRLGDAISEQRKSPAHGVTFSIRNANTLFVAGGDSYLFVDVAPCMPDLLVQYTSTNRVLLLGPDRNRDNTSEYKMKFVITLRPARHWFTRTTDEYQELVRARDVIANALRGKF